MLDIKIALLYGLNIQKISARKAINATFFLISLQRAVTVECKLPS